MSEEHELEREAARAALARDREVTSDARKRHGIVHTPAPIARYVARAVDGALRELGRAGIGDRDVTIVDPACGPGAFLAAVIARLDAESASSPLTPALSRERERGPSTESTQLPLPLHEVLRYPRAIVGVDRDAAAIAQARALLTGVPGLRLSVADTLASLDPLLEHERRGATIAILGNPPWAGRSENRGSALIEPLLDDFRRDGDGALLGERKIGVLSDAYVRFWRWSAEIARHAEHGAVVALVTNASYLDGPVHRGMRAALARWFARIDVVHLGGSSLVARARGADENVFGVRPGAAITIAVRPPGHDEPGSCALRSCALRYASLKGAREEKLTRLESDLALAPIDAGGRWSAAPRAPARYERWPSIADLVPFHREGVQTNRDALCVDRDRARLLARLRAFASGEPAGGSADRPSAHYDPERAREAIRRALEEDPELSRYVVRVAYRPLDVRWAALLPSVCHRPRPALLAAMQRSSFALVTVRKDRGELPWAHFGAVREPADNCFLSARSSCRARAFPTHGPDGTQNLDARALASFASRLDPAPDSAALLRYALAILASTRYRALFDDALRADYPRIPPPPSMHVFAACVDAGARIERALAEPAERAGPRVIVGHHAMESAELAEAIAQATRAADAAIDPA